MCKKTIKYLKKEFEKRKVTKLKDDFYWAVWAEKREFTEFLLFEFTCYLNTIFNAENGVRLKKVLNDNRQTVELLKNQKPKAADNTHQEDKPKDDCFDGKDDGVNIALLKLFLAPKYEPPVDNLVGLQVHIHFIDFCYLYLLPATGCYHWVTETKLDLALLKLTQCLHVMMQAMDLHITKTDQSKPGTIGKKKKAKDRERKAFEYIEKYIEEKKLNLPKNKAKVVAALRVKPIEVCETIARRYVNKYAAKDTAAEK